MTVGNQHPFSEASDTQVLITGAGPTGLLLALELERRGVSCLLIDAHDSPMGWDRATIVHARSLEIFESLGLADHFLAAGVKIKEALLRSDGQLLGVIDPRLNGSSYAFDLGLSEEATESILTEALQRHGGSVTRATRLDGLRQESDHVVATLEQNGESREVTAGWVVGCDGFRSTVRGLVGIEFPGADIEKPWAVFDAGLEGWNLDHDIQVAHLDAPPVILTPLPDRRYRVYLRPSSESSDLEAEALAVLERYSPGVAFTAVEDPTRFHCHSRVAERFRSGRVLLAGDAAHACTPGEGHGMNTGLQDAFNLGWKLAHVCRGEAGAGLLDSYESERRPVAIRVVESGVGAEAAQALATADERATRDAEIAKTFSDEIGNHHEAAAAAELDRSYAGSAVVSGEAVRGVGAGERLPDTEPVQLAFGEPRPLPELTYRQGHTVLIIGGPEADRDQVEALMEQITDSVAATTLIDATLAFSTDSINGEIGRIEASTTDQLGIHGLAILAIRPDRYIGLRHDAADPAALWNYIETLAS